MNRLDAGQDIPGLYADFSRIALLTSKPRSLIDPLQLPVDPKTCAPVYPHEYLKVNTVFEVAHQHGLHTAWSDKHPAYEILNGPSGVGVDDLFAPEINSSVQDPSLAAGVGPDFTKDNTNTQLYDALKVKAVLNWAKGLDHAGNASSGIPAIFGMNFQAVSTAQKLNVSPYYIDPSDPSTYVPSGLGGYTNAGTIPGVVLQSALTFVDAKLGELVSALDSTNTVLIVSAKHGQSPQNRADLTLINDGDMTDALNATWDANYQTDGTLPLVAHAMDDDGVLLWLNDRSEKATEFTKTFLENYSGNGIGSDASGNKTLKPFTHAGLKKIFAGAEAAELMGVERHDSRVPDVIGIAQQGTVYAGSKLSKIAEHGGDAIQDRHVPLLVWGAGVEHDLINDEVDTTQIAPTILKLLGLKPEALQAVRTEDTQVLPDLH